MADFLNYSLSNAQNIDVELLNIAEYKDILDKNTQRHTTLKTYKKPHPKINT